MENKRRHKRVPISATATLTSLEKDDRQSMQTMVADISFGGIGVYSDDTLPTDTQVSIMITFISTDGLMRSDSIEGHIVYDRKMGNFYFIGIKFQDELSSESQPSLYKHIQHSLK